MSVRCCRCPVVLPSLGGARPPTADHQHAFRQPGGRSRQFQALLSKMKSAGQCRTAPESAEKEPEEAS
eukprot:6411857-Alexandrium_andersonii.AAC.1